MWILRLYDLNIVGCLKDTLRTLTSSLHKRWQMWHWDLAVVAVEAMGAAAMGAAAMAMAVEATSRRWTWTDTRRWRRRRGLGGDKSVGGKGGKLRSIQRPSAAA